MAASVGTSSKSISGFDPRSLSGCVLWLDADDPYTLFSDAAGTTLATTTVNAWKDKSANALLFAGGTSGPTLIKSTTVNSRPYLSFNGTSNYLLNTSMSVSQPYTIYVVGYATASAASTYYRILHGLSAGSVNFNLVIGALAGNVAMFIGNASSWNDVNAIVPATTSINVWVIYSATVTGGTLNSFLNGTACTSKTGNIASTISGFNIGGGQSSTGYSTTQPFQGYVGEILMYNYVLSASQRQQVEGYLAWKWGMTSSSITKPTVITLPVSHSFSITKPHSRQFNLVDTPNLSTTPTNIPGCILWLDGKDTNTYSTTVTTWTDKSGKGNTATSAGTAGTITTSATGLVFGGAGYMTVPGIAGSIANTPFVIFMVETVTSAGYFFGDDNVNNGGTTDSSLHVGYRSLTNHTFAFYSNDLEDYAVSGSGAMRLWCFYLPISSNRVTRRNGAIDVIRPNYNRLQFFTAPRIGRVFGGAYYTGTISELLVYPLDIGISAIQQIEGYLAWKWNIILSSSHQYYGYKIIQSLPFYPTNLPGCLLWLDGNDKSTYATTVTTWIDKSGNGNTATTSEGTVTTSTTGLVFSGSQAMTIPGIAGSLVNTPFVIFVVETVGATEGFFFADNTENGGIDRTLHIGYRSLTNHTFAFYSDDLENNTVSGSGSMRLWCFYLPISSNRVTRRNGVVDVTHSNYNRLKNFTSPVIGRRWSGNYYNGTISEVLVYRLDIGLPSIQQIEGYLAAKWGIALPSTHTYFKFQPSQLAPPVSSTFSSSFTPGGIISGVKVWLDASDPTTLYSDQGTTLTTLGGPVAYWRDKSGSANHYTQTTAANQPIYSNIGGVLFPATNVVAVLINSSVWAGTSGYDVFCVSKPHSSTATGTWRTLLRGSGNDHPVLIEAGTTRIGAYNNAVGFYPFGSLTMDGSARTLLYVSISATNTYTASINGTIALSAATAALQNNNFGSVGNNYGGYQPWGEINELIIVPNCTTAQRQTIEGYLAAKWGLQTSLPVAQPYYSFSPTPMIAISGTTLTATWATSPDVFSYNVILYSQSTVDGALTSVSNVFQSTISKTYTVTTGLIYTVYVSIVDSAGISSVPAVSNSVPCLSTPVFSSVTISGSTLTASANAQPGATISYLISPAVTQISSSSGTFTGIAGGTTYTITAIVSAKGVTSTSSTTSRTSLATPTFTPSISGTTFTSTPSSSGASAYSVSLYSGTSGSGTLVTTNTTGTFTGLTAGTAYYVTAYATATNLQSITGTLATSINCLATPTMNTVTVYYLSALANSMSGAMTLSWGGITNATSYTVFSSTDGTSYTSQGVQTSPYYFTPTNTQRYWFRIVASGTNTTSFNSASVGAAVFSYTTTVYTFTPPTTSTRLYIVGAGGGSSAVSNGTTYFASPISFQGILAQSGQYIMSFGQSGYQCTNNANGGGAGCSSMYVGKYNINIGGGGGGNTTGTSSAGGGGATVIAFNSNSASSGFLIIGGGGGVAGVGSGTPDYQVGSGGAAGKGTLPAYNASTTTPTFFNGSNSKSWNGSAMADMTRGAGQGGTSTSGGAGQNGANAYSGNGGLLSGGTLGAGGGSGANNSGWCGGGGGGGYSGGSGGSTASNDPGWGGIYFAGGGGGGCTAGMNMFTTNVDGTSESWTGGGGYAFATW
jgi:hypothetical protein